MWTSKQPNHSKRKFSTFSPSLPLSLSPSLSASVRPFYSASVSPDLYKPMMFQNLLYRSTQVLWPNMTQSTSWFPDRIRIRARSAMHWIGYGKSRSPRGVVFGDGSWVKVWPRNIYVINALQLTVPYHAIPWEPERWWLLMNFDELLILKRRFGLRRRLFSSSEELRVSKIASSSIQFFLENLRESVSCHSSIRFTMAGYGWVLYVLCTSMD